MRFIAIFTKDYGTSFTIITRQIAALLTIASDQSLPSHRENIAES